MSSHDLLIIVLFIGILVAFTPLLGKWLANVLQGKRSWLSPVLGPVERCTYRVAGVDPSREMDWKKYLTAFFCSTPPDSSSCSFPCCARNGCR